jgi:predicted ATP-grasp superfamily ATP-dependent carboligase
LQDSRFQLDADLRRFTAERPPVVLLGGLDCLRPLRFAGIPAIVATPDPQEPALVSRHRSGRCLLPPLSNQAAVAEVLLAVGDRLVTQLGCRVPLFYGNDDFLDLIYAHREALEKRYLLLLNEPEIGHALIDKDRFEALARSRSLPVPRTLYWDGTGADALALATGPVIVKPKVKLGWDESPIYLRLVGGQGKAKIFENGRKLMDNPLASRLKDQLIVQEYLPGSDGCLWSFHGYADEQGELLAGFVGHKLRTYPALTGMSSYLEMVHDEEVAASGRHVVAQVPLKGVFKIDFKRDAVSGRLHVLEINARFNLWHHMGARNGINLPQLAYDYLVHGKRPAGAAYRTTFRWVYMRLDFQAYRELAAQGKLSLGSWLLSLLLSRKVYTLFSWTDPIPLVLRTRDRLGMWHRRAVQYVRTRVQQWLSTAL